MSILRDFWKNVVDVLAAEVGILAGGATPAPPQTPEQTKAAIHQVLDKKPTDEVALKKLVDTGGGKILDDFVKKMPDPPDRAAITAALEARFGVKMSDTDATNSADDVAEGNKSIKQIYLTMLKVPEIDVRNNPSLKEIDRQSGTNFPYYDDTTKKAVLPLGRADDAGNAIGNTKDWTDTDGKVHKAELVDVEDACKPKEGENPTYLSWSTLHEVGHAVDDKRKVMDGQGGNAYAGWQAHTVADVAKLAADALKYDVNYIQAYLTGSCPATTPPPPPGTDDAAWDAQRQQAEDWAVAVGVDSELWEKGAECATRAINGRVYHEAYPQQWVSYQLDARKKGISGYQFRAPGEWFAELYAACYTGKLKDNHPYVKWIKSV